MIPALLVWTLATGTLRAAETYIDVSGRPRQIEWEVWPQKPGPTPVASDDAAREQLFTLFNGPPVRILSGAEPITYSGPIRAHELRIVGPVTIVAPSEDAAGTKAMNVEIDAFVVRFVGYDASLKIVARGRSISQSQQGSVSATLADLAARSQQPGRGGRIDFRIGRVTFDDAARRSMLIRLRALDRIKYVDQSDEMVQLREEGREAAFDAKGDMGVGWPPFVNWFLEADNANGTLTVVDGGQPEAFGGGGFAPMSVKHISYAFTAETDREYVRLLNARLAELQRLYNEDVRTRDIGRLYRDLILYNSLPTFSPAVQDAEFGRLTGEINALRDRWSPLYVTRMTLTGPSGLAQPATLLYDLNDRAHPRLAPTTLLLRPLHGDDGRSALGFIHVNGDETVTVQLEAELRTDPLLQQQVSRQLRQDRNEMLEGTFANWTILDGDVQGPGIRNSHCRALGGKVTCEITFQRDASLTALLALGSSFGLPVRLRWRYAGQMPPGLLPAEGDIEVPLSLLRQNELSVDFAQGRLINRSALAVDVEYLARRPSAAGSDMMFTPMSAVLSLKPTEALPLRLPAGDYSVPPEAVYAAPMDPLSLLSRFRPVVDEPLLDWVRLADDLPEWPDVDRKEQLLSVDVKVDYGPEASRTSRTVRLAPARSSGSVAYLNFLRQAGARIAVSATANYRLRGAVALAVDASSFSIFINEASLPR